MNGKRYFNEIKKKCGIAALVFEIRPWPFIFETISSLQTSPLHHS
jgi:hypothetical protein